MSIAYQNYLNWRDMNETFDDFNCYRTRTYGLTGVGRPEIIKAMEASAGLLPMLGAQPYLGRFFDASDDTGETERTIVLSYEFWQRTFGGDPEVLGDAVMLNADPYTVIGILEPRFVFPLRSNNPADFWTPIGLNTRNAIFLNRGNHPGIVGVGKLKEGSSIEQAFQDLNRVTGLLAAEYPNSNAGVTMLVDDYHQEVIEDIRPGLIVLLCAVGCLLLIVCVNIAGLLLVRAAGRTAEFTFRAALGAGHFRIVRQLLCENLIVAIAGGALGFIAAGFGVRFLMSVVGDKAHLGQVSFTLFDFNGVVFFLTLILITGLLFGLFPAIQASISSSGLSLGGSRTVSSGRQYRRLKDVLVVTEVALALVLLTGAGLLVRSFQEYLKVGPGYNPDSTLIMNVSLPGSIYDSDEKKLAFHGKLLRQTRSLPGVSHVALCSNLLGGNQDTYRIEGESKYGSGSKEAPFAEYSIVTPNAIEALGMRLLAGRTFTEFDTADVGRVAIVDERLVRRWWSSNEEALGKRFMDDNEWHEIVGVVGHVKHYGIDQKSLESIYRPARQMPFGLIRLVVRSQAEPMTLVEPIRGIVSSIDLTLPLSDIITLESVLEEQSFLRRFLMSVLSIFAGAALLLSSIGLYGVAAYSVSQRTQEFGIRIALGACMEDIRRLVLKGGGKLALAGVGIGLVGAYSLGWLMRELLFGVPSADPITYVSVTVIIGAVAILASYLPSRQASKVSPMEALRAE